MSDLRSLLSISSTCIKPYYVKFVNSTTVRFEFLFGFTEGIFLIETNYGTVSE